MSLDGDGARDPVEAWRRITQTTMDALGLDLDSALDRAPLNLRERLRAAFAAENRQVTFHRPGAIIHDGGPKEWFASWDPAGGYLWRRLRQYLIDVKGRPLRDVEALDEASDSVLSRLEDPVLDHEHSRDEFRVQGLVLGYVQAGKTANFTALIAKAADRGYRLVIVLSGIHNSLRQQTQRRLDLELGLIDDPKGVGLPDPGQAWWRITNDGLNGDFKPGTDAGPLEQGSRGVMVVKKNATVLRRLVQWLQGRVPHELPVLIIDDEADQASINLNPQTDDEGVDLGPDTGEVPPEQELDPSTINGLIRDLIKQFHRVAYVAYTATPFANVLIDPDVESSTWGGDLFPGDFIISLSRPPGYVGAERVFGRPALEGEEEAAQGLDVVRLVPEHELARLIPRGKAAKQWQPTVTPSLEQALLDWLLSTAAKIHRLGDGVSSMLIHTTPRTNQQNSLATVVEDELRAIRNQWRYENESLRPALKLRWDTDFRPVTASLNADLVVPFEDIEPSLAGLLSSADRISLLVLNSTSTHELDYETDNFVKVVLIGGNRLSRGLTLEDLTVAFYVREANTYDTLLQMGRWFGYRSHYIDLTRLWTSDELVSRFRHLALVEEDLRDQIKVYEREQLTPRQVAPKIRSHPAMLVTARNRMGSAESVRQSYAGALLQSVRFRLGNDEWLRLNEQVTLQLLQSLGAPSRPAGPGDRPAWTDVPWTYVEAYLREFRTAQDAMSFDADTAAKYVRRQAEDYGELVRWTVGVRCGGQEDPVLGLWDSGAFGVPPMPRISRSRLKSDSGSIGVLTSPVRRDSIGSGDEALDLTPSQLRLVEQTLDDYPTVGHALRQQRPPQQGLLLIYPISPFSKPGPNARNRTDLFQQPDGRPTVVGVALSFPASNTGATVEYVAGRPSRHSIFSNDEV